jgi:hypothetical protein
MCDLTWQSSGHNSLHRLEERQSFWGTTQPHWKAMQTEALPQLLLVPTYKPLWLKVKQL